MSITHERDINGLATLAVIAKAEQCHSELSFCLPMSLAFAKRLTWEQTPWIPSKLNRQSVNPIGEADAYRIAQHLASHGHKVTQKDIERALLFGTTYAPTPEGDNMSGEMGINPHLFVIFPHASKVPCLDEQFLKIWHDQIVKPAFDRAWSDSGLTLVHGSSLDTPTRLLPPVGVRTQRDADPASGFLERLRNGKPGAVRDHWPVWRDSKWHLGVEGKYTHTRTRIYHEAWSAIKGMLKDHPQMSSYQNPILLAVSRAQIHVNTRLSTNYKFKCIAQEWDRLVDSRFVKPASFQVVFETAVGTMLGSAVEDKPVVTTFIADEKGKQIKRLADCEEDQGEDAHRSKRMMMSIAGGYMSDE
ncbi:hypothetical protein ACET3X_001192 [Alternaria dauci]|uniref:Uncharacterized protein n=1 Tax=Alternaria dauci TaxID=48095 RepID=A0ABR3UWJ5_9PLEO